MVFKAMSSFLPLLRRLTLTDILAEEMNTPFNAELFPNLEALSLIDVRNDTPLTIQEYKALKELSVRDLFNSDN